MIKAVIFDLDNTLLDFMKMKEYAVKAAIAGMIEAGLDIDSDESYLEKMGLDEADDDSESAIIKGKTLDGIDFSLEEDVFNSEEVVVTGIASERSVEV